MKLKTGDTVVIITGKDRGKTGKIMRVMKKTARIVVEKINIKKKHIKKTQSRAGEIISFEAPIHVSNVMLVDPKSGKRSRIGYKRLEDGKKIRIAKNSGTTLDEKVKTPKSKK
jgi:large subunit ribosomal protein L24